MIGQLQQIDGLDLVHELTNKVRCILGTNTECDDWIDAVRAMAEKSAAVSLLKNELRTIWWE